MESGGVTGWWDRVVGSVVGSDGVRGLGPGRVFVCVV